MHNYDLFLCLYHRPTPGLIHHHPLEETSSNTVIVMYTWRQPLHGKITLNLTEKYDNLFIYRNIIYRITLKFICHMDNIITFI